LGSAKAVVQELRITADSVNRYRRGASRHARADVAARIDKVRRAPCGHPRREVVVGPAGRALVRQSRMAPAVAERAMARQTDKSHLSRDEEAPATHGALHVPAPGKGAVHGGWGGRRRIAMRRTAVAAALAGAAGHRGPPDDPRSDGGLTAAIGCHAARGRSLREREPARRRQPCRPVRHLTRQGRYAVWVDCHPGC
jgi:hypothetical protein